MSWQRFLILLGAALLLMCAAFYFSSQRQLARDPRDTPFLPGLAAQLDQVSAVTIRKGNAQPSVTLQKQGDHWTIAQRNDYPADLPKVRRLLLSLGDAVVVEEKTSNPAYYAFIGVDDPKLPGSSGVEITLDTRDGIRSLIAGKPVGSGNFVRRAGEVTSFAVSPSISADADPRDWIDRTILDIPMDSIQKIAYMPPLGEPPFGIHRIKPGEEGFELDSVPAGRTALDARSIAPSPLAFGLLSAEEVTQANQVDFSKAPVAVVTLAEDKVITLTGAADGEKRWLTVQSTKDAAAKWRDRAFEVPKDRYEALFRQLDQLLQPKASPPPRKAAAQRSTSESTRSPSPKAATSSPPATSAPAPSTPPPSAPAPSAPAPSTPPPSAPPPSAPEPSTPPPSAPPPSAPTPSAPPP